MAVIAVGCNLLIGYGARSRSTGNVLLSVLPLLAAVAFMLISDIDTPRHGIIRVRPQNLISLAESLPRNPPTHPARWSQRGDRHLQAPRQAGGWVISISSRS